MQILKNSWKLSTICIVLIILFGFENYSHALILNIQPYLRKEAPEGFSMKMLAGGQWYTGNTEYSKIEGSIVGRYVLKNHLLLGVASYSNAWIETQYLNKHSEHLRYKYQTNDWLGLESFLQYEFDEFRRIAIRALGGAGPRFTVFSTKIFELTLATAYMPEYNKNSTGSYNDSGDETFYHRVQGYINLDFKLGKYVDFFSTTYYQPKVDEFGNYRLLNDNTLSITLNDTLKLLIVGIISYNSEPPDSVDDKDTSFKSIFEIKFN